MKILQSKFRFCKRNIAHVLSGFTFLLSGFIKFLSSLNELMPRTLAPLRRIAARDIEVFGYSRISPSKPLSFVIHDLLECGHTKDLLTWDLHDLLNAYTIHPEVSARRHRCIPCLQLLAHPKPVRSVGIAAHRAVSA